MDRYCYNCGAELMPGDIFCSNCGTKVNDDMPKSVFQACFLSECNHESEWLRFTREAELPSGIILTDISILAKQINNSTSEGIRDLLIDYTVAKHNQGDADYALMDLSEFGEIENNKLLRILQILEKLNRLHQIKYLFIIGNNRAVPIIRWKDELEDDYDVESDLCFSTLNISSPWKGLQRFGTPWIRSGRLPVFDGEQLYNFKSYLENSADWQPREQNDLGFGLSAEVWSNASEYVFSRISKRWIYTSPEYTDISIADKISDKTGIFYFNLHGSSITGAKYWYGQRGDAYPRAFSPDLLSDLDMPYVIGVEACYGARYNGYEKNDSSLLTAIGGKCLAFLGSSRIAYGSSEGEGSCADIMVGEFLRKVVLGYSFGDALYEAQKKLLIEGIVREPEIKTLAEFSLYGDPSLRYFSGRLASKELSVDIPDIRAMVIHRVDKANDEINTRIKSYIIERHEEMLSIKPEVYCRSKDNEMIFHYKKAENDIKQALILVTNNNGEIIKEYVSR